MKCKVLQSGEQKSVEQYVVPILHVFCVIHSVSQYILREDIKRRFYSSSSIDVFLKPFPSEVYETLKYCAKPNKTSVTVAHKWCRREDLPGRSCGPQPAPKAQILLFNVGFGEKSEIELKVCKTTRKRE